MLGIDADRSGEVVARPDARGPGADGVAQQRLVDPDSIPDLSPDRRRAMVRAVAAWGEARARLSPADLRVELLKTTTKGYEFRTAAEKGLESGDPRVAPIVLARFDEFPQERTWLLRICSGVNTDAFVPLARRLVAEPAGDTEHDWDASARVFYSGLILLRHGDPAGLPALRNILAGDADGSWAREAYVDLLKSRDPAARVILCGSARKPGLLLDDHNSALLRRLFREGCEGVADSLLARLGSTRPAGMVSSWNASAGEAIERQLVEGDRVADYLVYWRPGGMHYDRIAPDEQRARARRELRLWLAEQARRVRAGEAPDFRP